MKNKQIEIVPVTSAKMIAEAVRVQTAAFGKADEGELVRRLHEAGAATVSLTAVSDSGQAVGHILFSPVRVVHEAAEWSALGLAPLGVLPALHKQGIGGQLIRAGLAACKALGEPVVFVLGHSEYYPRFGFSQTRPFGIDCVYDVPPEVFMVAELEEGAINGRLGTVHYHAVFG